ncbi:MAG: sugar ABC transporter permease [Micromonosporaceae bacterium]|nr:sugar ABC transporter permease [Micromonosporaceae bacterium]
MKRQHAVRRRQSLRGLAFASPYLVGFAIFIAWPVAASAWYSLTDFNLFQPPHFVGLGNYRHMLHDKVFWKSLTNTVYLTVVGVPLGLALSLIGALILNHPVRGQPLYRALVYLPTIVPVVVSGYLWRWLMNPQYGYIDELLRLLHLPQPLWLDDPAWGKPAVLLVTLWTVGGMTVIFLAALRNVPKELYEAAAMDGAGPIARFWHVTWPMISPVTLFQVIVSTIAYLQVFTQPYLLAQTRLNTSSAGPENSMLSYSMYLFQNAFVYLKMGYASAMAWVLFLVTMAVTVSILLNAKRWVHDGSR